MSNKSGDADGKDGIVIKPINRRHPLYGYFANLEREYIQIGEITQELFSFIIIQRSMLCNLQNGGVVRIIKMRARKRLQEDDLFIGYTHSFYQFGMIVIFSYNEKEMHIVR